MREIKEILEKEHDLKADTLRLIGFGKVLEDEQKASDISLKENDQLVLMVLKPKPPPKPKAEAPAKEAAGATVQPS